MTGIKVDIMFLVGYVLLIIAMGLNAHISYQAHTNMGVVAAVFSVVLVAFGLYIVYTIVREMISKVSEKK